MGMLEDQLPPYITGPEERIENTALVSNITGVSDVQVNWKHDHHIWTPGVGISDIPTMQGVWSWLEVPNIVPNSQRSLTWDATWAPKTPGLIEVVDDHTVNILVGGLVWKMEFSAGLGAPQLNYQLYLWGANGLVNAVTYTTTPLGNLVATIPFRPPVGQLQFNILIQEARSLSGFFWLYTLGYSPWG